MHIVVLYDGEAGHPAREFVYDVEGNWIPRREAKPRLWLSEESARGFADSLDLNPMEEVEVEVEVEVEDHDPECLRGLRLCSTHLDGLGWDECSAGSEGCEARRRVASWNGEGK